jgi:ADP-ribose pyrophosphatase
MENKEEKKKFTDVRKVTDNPFFNLYEMDALTNSGKPFGYYFGSRNDEDHIKLKTKAMNVEGIVIYPVVKEEPDKIVMIRQYRYPLDACLYELPAGLVDGGETPAQAAIREMKEETGLDFEVYEGGNPAFRRPFFMGAGFTDECSAAVFGYAHGKISDRYLEDSESIQVLFADKKEALRILQEERVSLRCAYLLMQFLRSEAGEPFGFLM